MAGLTKASLPPRLFCDIRNRGAAVCVMLYEDGIVARETPKLLVVLAPEERARHERMATSERRNEYLVGRLLIRTVLSALLEVPCAQVPLVVDSRGRPHVVCRAPLVYDINLSHSRGYAVLGVTKAGRIGVDVEATFDGDYALVRRFLASEELAGLLALPQVQHNAALARAWVIKEAWSKALGVGLRVPFRNLNTALRSEGCTGRVRWRIIDGSTVPTACAIASDELTPPSMPGFAIPVKLENLSGAA